jgi:carbon storage regulator CsrA
MLVLSRRVNETIVFPGLDITVRVVRLQGNTVRIGIEAPAEMPIVRGELVPQPRGRSGGRRARPSD